MSEKRTVKFTRGDAPRPTLSDSGEIELRAPVPFVIGPGAPVRISLGLRADAPLLVSSLRVDLDRTFFAAGEDIVLRGTGRVAEPTPVSVGQRLATAIPVAPVDFDIE